MKILLTGASGFIGKYLSQHTKQHDIRSVVRGQRVSQSSGQFTIDSLDGRTNWSGAFTNIESVIHLAGAAHNGAISNKELDEINHRGTINLANQAAENGVKRFVFVSSIGVNGSFTKGAPFTPCSTPNPSSAYGRSKYAAELGLKKIAASTGMELVIIRPPLVYGANAPGNFAVLKKLVSYSPVLPFGLIDNQRDFISVQNLSDLLITCVSHPSAAGNTFLASDGETVSIKLFTNLIAKSINKSLIQLPVPRLILENLSSTFFGSHLANQLFGDLQIDISSLAEILGWVPPFSVEQSMCTN